MDFNSTVKGSALEGFYPAGWDFEKIDACIGVDGILSTNGGQNYSSRCAADRIPYETISTVLRCVLPEGNADQRDNQNENNQTQPGSADRDGEGMH